MQELTYMNENHEDLKDFEINIIEHWKKLTSEAVGDEKFDLIDATVDFLEKFPSVEFEELNFSDGFKDKIRRDGERRNMLEKKKDKTPRSLNKLEI